MDIMLRRLSTRSDHTMSPTATAKPAEEIRINDSEYRDGIAFLREASPAFQRYEQEIIQMIVDNLSASNCMAEAAKADIVSVVKTMKHLSSIQDINRAVMSKIRSL